MIINLNIFTLAIRILKANDSVQVNESLQTLNELKLLAETTYTNELKELRRVFIIYKKYEEQINVQKKEIEKDRIKPWVPLLKKQQESSIFPDVRAATLSQIVNSKEEMDRLDASLEEMKLRLFFQARTAKIAFNELQKLGLQVVTLETAEDLRNKFNNNSFKIEEIAEYEIPKYFEIYRKGS